MMYSMNKSAETPDSGSMTLSVPDELLETLD